MLDRMSEMWDGVAGAWERNAELVDVQLAGATAVMLDAAQVGPGDAVLDVAAGPGGAGMAAAGRVGDRGRVVLSDDAPAMMEAAARLRRRSTWTTRASTASSAGTV
jgi:ubiquinone/menaquinone biosynthesis C-methylase UbiE